MKFCYNTKFTLPKQSQRSRSILQDGSRSLGLFWKEKTLSYNRRNVLYLPYKLIKGECNTLAIIPNGRAKKEKQEGQEALNCSPEYTGQKSNI